MTGSKDITDRLRDHDGNGHRDGYVCIRCQAANEIETLRKHIELLISAADETKHWRIK